MRYLSSDECTLIEELAQEIADGMTPASLIAPEAIGHFTFALDEQMEAEGASGEERAKALRAAIADIEQRAQDIESGCA